MDIWRLHAVKSGEGRFVPFCPAPEAFPWAQTKEAVAKPAGLFSIFSKSFRTIRRHEKGGNQFRSKDLFERTAAVPTKRVCYAAELRVRHGPGFAVNGEAGQVQGRRPCRGFGARSLESAGARDLPRRETKNPGRHERHPGQVLQQPLSEISEAFVRCSDTPWSRAATRGRGAAGCIPARCSLRSRACRSPRRGTDSWSRRASARDAPGSPPCGSARCA